MASLLRHLYAATQQPGPCIIPGIGGGCVQVLLQQIPPPEMDSVLFFFNQLSPINMLDTENFPSEWEKTPLGQAMPGKKEKVWIQPFLPCSGLLAWSIPGMHVHGGHASAWASPRGRMWWLVFVWLWFFSSKGQWTEGRGEGYSALTWTQPGCPGTHVGIALDFSRCVASQ